MSKRFNAPLKDIKAVNSILCKYFTEYYITNTGNVYGNPRNDSYRCVAVIDNPKILDIYTNTYFDADLSKRFFNDAKITLTDFKNKSDCMLFDMYEKDSNKPYDTFKLYKINHEGINYDDIGTIDNRHLHFLSECIQKYLDPHDLYHDMFTEVSRDVLKDIAAKKFACIGGVIVSIGEIPNPDKITKLSYVNVQSNDADDGHNYEFTFNTEKYTDSYIILIMSHDDIGITVFKLMKYAFPIDEFHI